MDEKEYIERGAAIATACKGCNKEFPNEPCEPAGCYIQQKLFKIPAADVVERTNWIDAKTNPPKEQGKYLCAIGRFCIDICSYALNLEKVDECDFYKQKRSGWYQYDSEYGHFERDDVTHYMPLPDPPKEEE